MSITPDIHSWKYLFSSHFPQSRVCITVLANSAAQSSVAFIHKNGFQQKWISTIGLNICTQYDNIDAAYNFIFKKCCTVTEMCSDSAVKCWILSNTPDLSLCVSVVFVRTWSLPNPVNPAEAELRVVWEEQDLPDLQGECLSSPHSSMSTSRHHEVWYEPVTWHFPFFSQC